MEPLDQFRDAPYPANAEMQLRPAMLVLSYRQARMPSYGSRIRCGPAHETKRYSPQRILAAPNDGARGYTTAGVVLRQPFWDHTTHNPAGQRMHCMKLLDQRLAARDFDRQVADVQIRSAIRNGFTALGIPRTVTVE
jgi:hypothetical protein